MPSDLFAKNYFTASGVTDVGVLRKNNEDAFLCLPDYGCFVISDGMGGGNAGEVASTMITNGVKNKIVASDLTPVKRQNSVVNAIYSANADIAAFASKKGYASMGATVICLLLDPWDPHRANVYHAGDSRLYRLRSNSLECLTADHTVSAASGVPDSELPKYMRGVLTNVVGVASKFYLECHEIEIKSEDTYLLCTDGLYRQIEEPEIRKMIVYADDSSPDAILDSFIDTANSSGGVDNISGVMVKFGFLPEEYIPSPEELKTEKNTAIITEPEAYETPSTQD